MDCQMPGLDGYEATRQIRLREAGARHVPIVAATAHAFESERGKTSAAGMDDHLPKPISMQSLATMIARWALRDPNQTHSAAPGSGHSPPASDVREQSAMPDIPEIPILDPEVLRSAAVVRVFKNHVPEQLERIRCAISAANREELAQAAHRLKGSCTMFGAPRMAELCLKLERGVGDFDQLFAELVKAHEQVLAHLSRDE
jgi:CheY-like chemotaxis protein